MEMKRRKRFIKLQTCNASLPIISVVQIAFIHQGILPPARIKAKQSKCESKRIYRSYGVYQQRMWGLYVSKNKENRQLLSTLEPSCDHVQSDQQIHFMFIFVKRPYISS